jgi:hypothetical protein
VLLCKGSISVVGVVLSMEVTLEATEIKARACCKG